MVVNTMLPKCCQAVATRAVPMLLTVGSVLALCMPATGLAQTKPLCGVETKEAIARVLASVSDDPEEKKLTVEAGLYAKYYEGCVQDAKLAPASFYEAADQCGAQVSTSGSLFFEEMNCCGYDPQRRQFACPVKINQLFGFGTAPLPGSREYVLHCVANAAGIFVPVGHDSVHLANAIANQRPPWQFAVIANAHENLALVYPMNGQTRQARSILSWGFRPTHCGYKPIWGNALDYQIRLDQ
ncbi:MAG TPA: hypothetical protein VI542_24300 [Candidatus Tectomicrobia bacterium]